MTLRDKTLSPRIVYASMALLMGTTAMTAVSLPALAQDQTSASDQSALEEVVVTGSRIVRKDYESNSPIVTVQKDLFDMSGTASIESNLNKLPQFTPTLKNPTQGGDIQPTALNTPGSATVSLRGIGANRSLVLLDGRRATPSNASMVVDINTIPQAAIERVEIISGGASSTYGADAMAGVVNFILKKNFQGLELDGQSSVSQYGDNFEYQVSGIMGTDFADGKGNISLAFSTNERKSALQKDRPWYRDLWADPNIGGTQFFAPFSGFTTDFFNPPSTDALNTAISGATFTPGMTAPGNMAVYTDSNGNVFTGTDASGVPGASGATFVDGQHFVNLANGQIGTNNTANYLIFPLTRYNMYARGNYEINDYVGVFAQGYFSKVGTTTVQEPSPIVSGWGVNIDPTINRDVIPADLLTVLDSRANPDAPFSLRALLPFNRGSETDVYTYNITTGLQGTIPGTDWTWEAFVQQGQSETSVLQTGFASLQRMQAVITSGPDFGKGFDSVTAGYSNPGAPNYGFGASRATCTTGLNVFDWASVSQDCYDAIKADIKTKAVMSQSIWEANLQGKVADLPAGELRASVGASYRKNSYKFENDTLTTQGTSFIEQALGLYPAGNSEGSITAKEGYGELLIPILADMPGIQRLELNLGARVSDYNTTGTSWTYKAEGTWQINDWVRVRGGYNRAERAPNIGELYLAPQQTFAVAGGGDVCSTNNGSAWSANAAANPNHWQDVVGLCGQLMKASGNSTADSQYYGVSAAAVASGTAPTNPQAAGPAFVFPTLVGNPNLSPEKADTWTLGVVLNSPWQSEALRNLRLTVDYYNIKISDAIGAQTVDILQRQCFDPAFNPNFDINSPYCAGVVRNQTGNLGNIRQTYFNNGRFKTSGIDIQLDWGMDVGPGHLSVNSVFNYLIDLKSSELAVIPETDYAGTFGPTENGLNGSSYRYKVLTTVGYTYENLYLGVQWHHLPSIKSATAATVPGTAIEGAKSYDLFGLQGSYMVTDAVMLRFGIDNVFNRRPPLTNVNTAATLPTLSGGSFNTNNYDTNGRRFYVGAKLDF